MSKSKSVFLVYYDLPVKSTDEEKQATKFQKHLIRGGYVRIQKSVYAKLSISREGISAEHRYIDECMPKEGSIFLLPISLNDFKNMKTVCGTEFDMKLFADDVVEL